MLWSLIYNDFYLLCLFFPPSGLSLFIIFLSFGDRLTLLTHLVMWISPLKLREHFVFLMEQCSYYVVWVGFKASPSLLIVRCAVIVYLGLPSSISLTVQGQILGKSLTRFVVMDSLLLWDLDHFQCRLGTYGFAHVDIWSRSSDRLCNLLKLCDLFCLLFSNRLPHVPWVSKPCTLTANDNYLWVLILVCKCRWGGSWNTTVQQSSTQ